MRLKSVGREVVVALLVGFTILGFCDTTLSQDYPAKAIGMVVGMDPGGIADVATRVLSEEANKTLGQDFLSCSA